MPTKLFLFMLSLFFPFSLWTQPVEEMDLEAYESLELPQMPALLRMENDHQMTQSLVEQTQAQLQDFERLLEEYERFCELEEKLVQKPQDRELAKKIMASALALEEIIQKRHLEGLFSTSFSQQVNLFSKMAKKYQSQTTLPIE
jgi:hypothetical protein